MIEDEARDLGESIDFVLSNDAQRPEDRRRLLQLRRQVQHVEDTGTWPAADTAPDEPQA